MKLLFLYIKIIYQQDFVTYNCVYKVNANYIFHKCVSSNMKKGHSFYMKNELINNAMYSYLLK